VVLPLTNIRRLVFVFFSTTLTFINFIAFLVSRNNWWISNPGRSWQAASITEFRDYPSSEFERVLSCYAIFSCQRAGSSLLVQPVILLADLVSKAYFWNVDSVERIFVIQIVGVGWRALCIGLLAYAIYISTRSFSFTLLSINMLLITISGVWLRVVGEIAIHLSVFNSQNTRSRIISAFRDFPHEPLFSYDYTNFIIIAVVIFLGSRPDNDFKFIRLFITGVVLTSLFEFFGFVFALSLLLLDHLRGNRIATKASLKNVFAVLLGSVVWIFSISLYFLLVRKLRPEFYVIHPNSLNGRGGSGDLFWALKNPIENLTKNPSILFQILLTLAQAACGGFVFGQISRLAKTSNKVDSKFIDAILCTCISMAVVQVIVIFATYGVDGMAGEHSRQTIGLQIAFFLYTAFRTSRTNTNKNILVQAN